VAKLIELYEYYKAPMPDKEDYEVPGRPAMSEKLFDLACTEWSRQIIGLKRKELLSVDSYGNT
jgi:hypothetical protein